MVCIVPTRRTQLNPVRLSQVLDLAKSHGTLPSLIQVFKYFFYWKLVNFIEERKLKTTTLQEKKEKKKGARCIRVLYPQRTPCKVANKTPKITRKQNYYNVKIHYYPCHVTYTLSQQIRRLICWWLSVPSSTKINARSHLKNIYIGMSKDPFLHPRPKWLQKRITFKNQDLLE